MENSDLIREVYDLLKTDEFDFAEKFKLFEEIEGSEVFEES